MRITLLLLTVAALASCTRGADLPASLVASDATAVFDTVVDAPLARRTFSFTNVGLTKTPALQLELHGDRDAFTIDWDSCTGAILEQDGHCDVVVRLDGVAAGDFDGELRVFAGAPLSASVVLHGKVTPASLSLTALSSATTTAAQGQTAMLAFTVHNGGGATTGVIGVAGRSLPFDNVSGDCDGATLAGGASCTIKMSIAVGSDAAIGSSTGTLEVAANPGGDVTASPTLIVYPTAVLSVSSFDYGTVPTLTPTNHTFTITNPGPKESGPLAIDVSTTELSPVFSLTSDGCSGNSLAVGGSCSVVVTLRLYDALKHAAMLDASAPNLQTGHGALSATGVRAHWTLWLSAAGNGTGKVSYGNGAPMQLPNGGYGVLFGNGEASQAVTAMADSGSTFAGWSGTAPCTGSGTCAGFVGPDNTDVTLVATFTK